LLCGREHPSRVTGGFWPSAERAAIALARTRVLRLRPFHHQYFTGKEWGYGDESPALFNPTEFDARQIARTARQAGMKGLILTAKHHDGFCLWPSAFTEHSVKHSPWKNGKGDAVKEIAAACRAEGIKFGVYLSPWDRNHKDYGRPEYVTYYRNQVRELLTGYGEVFEFWLDGANGGDGFYGGARETRKIDRRTYYDWPNTVNLVRELQPGACIFSDGGPDLRWVGNERGGAGDPCWATLNRDDFAPGQADQKRLTSGDRPGTHWIPAECDVSIRPGWFYHAAEDAKVKTATQLVDLYFASVGRGASLLLNLAPDQRGQIPDVDVRQLMEFRRRLDDAFTTDLARRAKVNASNVREASKKFRAANVTDSRRESYWATDDGVTNASLVIEFRKPTTLNIVRLREFLTLGQRVEVFALDRWSDGAWEEFHRGTGIGNCRLVRVKPFSTDKLRVRIINSPASPALSEVGVFLEKENP
jgi:alpha-L-fucosidase